MFAGTHLNLSRNKSAKLSLSMIALAIGLAGLILMEVLLFPMTVDDAFISFHYADNWAQGDGLVWHPGEDPVEGYTNFLWVALCAVVIRLGLDVVIVGKILGMLFSLGSVVILSRITGELDHEKPKVAVALMFGFSPALALWAISGLETSLYVFLLLMALYQFLREENEHGRPHFSLLWLMFLSLTRPEGAVLFGLFVALRLLMWRKQGVSRERLRRFAGWAIAFGLISLSYFFWRWNYFGYPLPNTFYVKAQLGLEAVARQIGVYLIPFALRTFPFILLAVWALGQTERIERGDWYVTAALMTLTLINLISSDWMPAHRLALPLLPLILLLARRPLEMILVGITHGNLSKRLSNFAILFGLVCYMIAPTLYAANLYNRVLATQMDMSVYRWATEMESIVDGQYVKTGQWLKENASPDATVVAGNVGAIAYYSDLKVIDQIGLTDEYIARNGWSVEYLLAQEPDFIVLESDTAVDLSGQYSTGGEYFMRNAAFKEMYELLFILDNGRTHEDTLFNHHLPHATWLFAHKDLAMTPAASLRP